MVAFCTLCPGEWKRSIKNLVFLKRAGSRFKQYVLKWHPLSYMMIFGIVVKYVINSSNAILGDS